MNLLQRTIRQIGLNLAGMPYYDEARALEFKDRNKPAWTTGRTGGQLYTVVDTRLSAAALINKLQLSGLSKYVDTYESHGSYRIIWWDVHNDADFMAIRPALKELRNILKEAPIEYAI